MYYGKWLRQIADAIRGLAVHSENLRGISEKIDQLTATIAHQQIEQQKANQKEWEKTQEILTRPHRTDPNEQTSNETNQERRHWQNFGLQGALTLGTWLAFAAAAIYAWEAYRQGQIMSRTLCEIQKQTKAVQESATATQKAAVAAQQSADVARDALLTQRAVVYLGGPHFDSAAKTISFPMINSGHINSGEVEITSYEFAWVSIQNAGNAEGHWRKTTYESVPIGDGSTIPRIDPGEVYFDADALRSGRSGYIIGFEITYDDGFSNRRKWSTVLCSSLNSQNHNVTLDPCQTPHALEDVKKKTKYPDPSTRR